MKTLASVLWKSRKVMLVLIFDFLGNKCNTVTLTES